MVVVLVSEVDLIAIRQGRKEIDGSTIRWINVKNGK